MQILFFITNLADFYYHRRINALNQLGAKVEILAFTREWYQRKKYDYPYILLGKIQHRHYFKRLLKMLKANPTVKKRLRDADVVYIFGLDMLLLYWLSALGLKTKAKVVFEVCDIQQVLIGNSLMSRLIRLTERLLMRKIHILVVTSKAFVTEFFQNIQGLNKLRYLVIENKLDKNSHRLSAPKKLKPPSDILRIGYFGMIRCPRSLEILKIAAEKGKGRVRIYIRGFYLKKHVVDIDDYIKGNPWIEYGGQYLSPDDCPHIYGNVDIVWACYPYGGTKIGNWLWARTNRFYEACFYKKPMIAQVNSQDGQVVKEKGLGICLDLSDINACVEQILTISPDDLQRWHNNIEQLPEDLYTYTNEHQQLLDILNSAS